MMPIRLERFQPVRNYSPVLAVAEVRCGGVLLRGLKLERRPDGFALAAAGRRINGAWQEVYELLDPELEARLLDRLVEEYRRRCPELPMSA